MVVLLTRMKTTFVHTLALKIALIKFVGKTLEKPQSFSHKAFIVFGTYDNT